jgi:hypothetical protein
VCDVDGGVIFRLLLLLAAGCRDFAPAGISGAARSHFYRAPSLRHLGPSEQPLGTPSRLQSPAPRRPRASPASICPHDRTPRLVRLHEPENRISNGPETRSPPRASPSTFSPGQSGRPRRMSTLLPCGIFVAETELVRAQNYQQQWEARDTRKRRRPLRPRQLRRTSPRSARRCRRRRRRG